MCGVEKIMVTSQILHRVSVEGTPNLSLVLPVSEEIASWGPKEIFNKAREIKLPKSRLFGTDGIRGKVGDFLTAELALQVGFWSGLILKSLSTNPGPDYFRARFPKLQRYVSAMALSAGLTSAGLDVWNLGLCPTPCVSYLTSVSEASGGVMISASHNPPGDNGIKFFGLDGTKLSGAIQKQIEAGIRGQSELSDLTDHGGT